MPTAGNYLGRIKPVGFNVGIDWDGPLARNLVGAFLFSEGGGQPRNLVYNRAIGVGTTPSQVLTPYGLAADTFAGTNAANPELGFTSGPWSVFAFFEITNFAAGQAPSILDRINYINETTNQGWQLQVDGGAGTFRFISCNNNDTTQYSLNGTTAVANGNWTLLGTSDGTTRTIYVNGQSEAQAATNPNPAANTTTGLDNGADVTTHAPIYLAYMWSRALTASEAAYLNANPYALFDRPRRRNAVRASSGAGAVLIGAANIPIVGAGSLSTSIALVGDSGTVVRVTGGPSPLTTSIALGGAARIPLTGAGPLTTSIPLIGATNIPIVGAGPLSTSISLAGDPSTVIRFLANGDIRVTPLTGDVTVIRVTGGPSPLSTSIALVGAAQIPIVGAGPLSTSIPLSGDPSTVLRLTGAGQLTTAIAFVGDLGTVIRLTGAGTLITGIALAGSAVIPFTGAGSMLVLMQIAGDARITLAGSANLATAIALAGAAQIPIVGGASLTTAIPLAGGAIVPIVGAGPLSTAIPLSGGAVIPIVGAGSLSTSISLSGAAVMPFVGSAALQTSIAFAGSAAVLITDLGTLLTAIVGNLANLLGHLSTAPLSVKASDRFLPTETGRVSVTATELVEGYRKADKVTARRVEDGRT